MKLGISYNLFDGEELLESSIKSVRNSTDHINVIYQKISNWGEPCSKNLEDLLSDLVKRKLIDKIHCPQKILRRVKTNSTKEISV